MESTPPPPSGPPLNAAGPIDYGYGTSLMPPGPGTPAAPGYPATASPRVYAGWWQRVGATFIDGLIAFALYLPGIVLFVAAFAAGHDGTCTGVDGELRTCRRPQGGLLLLGVLLFLGGVVGYYVVYCRKLGRTGQTWGRKAMGYRVVDDATLEPIGALRAFGRMVIGGLVDGAICYLGLLWPLWDQKKQKWSDKIMNTVAVKV